MKQLLPLLTVVVMLFALPSTTFGQHSNPCTVTVDQIRFTARDYFQANRNETIEVQVGVPYGVCLNKNNANARRAVYIQNIEEVGQGAVGSFQLYNNSDIQELFPISEDEPVNPNEYILETGSNGLSFVFTAEGTFTLTTQVFRNFATSGFSRPLAPVSIDFNVVANVAAPVTWTKDLAYEPFGENVRFNWSVAEQIDVEGYELERMFEGGVFEKVGDIAYQENGSLEVNYSTVTNWPSRSAYYRIKQLDYAGTFDYSNTVFVDGNDNVAQQFKMFPNPATDFVRLSVPEGIRSFDLISASGQVVRSYSAAEASREGLDVSQVSAGMYFVRPVGNEGAAQPQRLVVNH